MTLSTDYFDEIYRSSPDPWGFQDRWYEQRKRALTLALLPQQSYDRAVEIGCSIGVLTAELAPRCGSLLATDTSSLAVDAARERCRHLPQVTVQQTTDWPPGAYDLAVLSEVLYYFARPEALAFAGRAMQASTVLAVHWRHLVDDYPLTGDEAHQVLQDAASSAGLVRVAHYLDEDLVAGVWTRDPRSVAEHEGLA